MTTEDYKKLAPYNVRQKSGDEEDSPFSADEHKKRAEAANSVLRRSAGRERAYVLSAAKKSNGSPTQEFPALFAKRNAEDRQDLNGKSPLEKISQRGEGDRAVKEKPERFPWDEGAPRATNGRFHLGSVTLKCMESSCRTFLKLCLSFSSFPEHTEANNGFYPPESPLQSDVPFHGTERTPVHIEDTEYSFKRSGLGYEERSGPTNPEGPSHQQPYWDETRFLDSGSLTERGPGASGHDSPPEPPRLKDPAEPSRAGVEALCKSGLPPGCVSENTLASEGDLSVPVPRSELCSQDTAGSRDRDMGMSSCVQSEDSTAERCSSVPGGSSIPAPDIPHAKEPEPRQDRIPLDREEQSPPSTESHRDSPGGWRHSEPGPGPARSDFSSSQERIPSGHESQHPLSLLQERQGFGGSVPSHRIPAYVDSQVFSTRRPSPDAQGSVYSGSSWYDSARGHGDFSPAAGRDVTMSMAQRSHRVPFYMDSLNSTRLLSSSSERLCSSHPSSGYQPDPSTAGRGILFVKEYVNTGGFAASPRHGSGSLVDLSDLERSSYSQHSFLPSAPLHRSSEPLCTYCSREIRDCPKIIIEHLNIHCHEYCFRCGICHKAMGDLLDKIFIHRDIVHCDKCYEKLF
ncbi:PREDICTED: zinc finger protein 185 [Sturnus vulgaris]|uniref:zinc finger protein 185 n=1 Tax=Sturnus vulgaris TaxID=9172 RepID=UPI000719FD24|nr:PREDICTED: zinc finger protein 185 [Sturnus vulgaris]